MRLIELTMARPRKDPKDKYRTPRRQLGAVDDATWTELQSAAKREGKTFIGWALPILLRAARKGQ